MREIIDIHCHFVKFDHFPDEYTKHLLKNHAAFAAYLFDEDCSIQNFQIQVIKDFNKELQNNCERMNLVLKAIIIKKKNKSLLCTMVCCN